MKNDRPMKLNDKDASGKLCKSDFLEKNQGQ